MSKRPGNPRAAGLHSRTGHCDACGAAHQSECGYGVEDRLLETLILALCRGMGLTPYRKGTGGDGMIYVMADDATESRLSARIQALVPALDAKLMALTQDFIREHCGLEIPVTDRK